MIGLFNECFPPVMDGVSVTVSNLASQFQEKGEDVTVVTPEIPGLDATLYPYTIMQYYSVPVPGRHPYRYGFPFFDYKFQKRFASTSFDLFHAHSPFSSGDFALKMSRKMGVPMVASFHSKYRDDFERVIPNKVIVDFLISKLVKFYESVDEVWVPQPSVGEVLREYGYKGHYEVVDNGSEFAGAPYTPLMQIQAKQELYVEKDEPLLLFVGQHIWEKNVRLIIEALARVKDMRFHAFFVGDGYAMDEMKQLALKLGLFGNKDYRKDRITFWGSVKSRDLMKTLYMAADLFLFPSLYDNAPLVVREAASLHTPSLVTRGSSTSEFIRDGINGFLADNDVQAFANRLRYLLERPVVIGWAAKGASESLARSWENVSQEVLDRYQHLILRKQNKMAI